MGCAWAAFFCYGSMMVASYFVGKAKHPIGYPMKRIGGYFLLAAVMYVLGLYVLNTPYPIANYAIRAVLLVGYAAIVVRREHVVLPKFSRK
jgi:hypothetical protein